MKKNYSLPVLTKEDVKFADSGQSTRILKKIITDFLVHAFVGSLSVV